MVQDDKAEVVANDAGDRVTPAVVAFTDTEQVIYPHLCVCLPFHLVSHLGLSWGLSDNPAVHTACNV